MKKIISPYMQYNMSLWILIVVLGIYSCITTYFALRNIPDIKIVAVESTGTRLVTDSKDKVFEKEEQEFVKRFLRLYTNYDSESITETIGKSTEWMSDAVWKKLEDSYKKTREQIVELKMVQISEITKLEQSDGNKNDYVAVISTRQIYRGISKKLRGTISLRIKQKPRSEVNPWGLEVDEIVENWRDEE
jgi:hypothetical protein